MMSSTAGNGGRVELSALMEGRSDASSVADFSRIVSGEMLRSALGNDDDGDDGLRRVAEENQDFRSLANMSLKSLSPSSSPSRGGVQRNATLTVDESGFLALSSHEEAQASLREEVEVEDDVYNTNTKWFGLSFRSRNVERAFLNGHATMHRRIVYKGYGLQICAGIFFVIQSLLVEVYRANFCKRRIEYGNDRGVDFCMEMFNMTEEESGELHLNPVFFAYVTVCGALFNAGGAILNYYLHKKLPSHRKHIAIWVVWGVYALELCFLTLSVLFGKNSFYMWPLILFLTYLTLFTISIWFTGTLFVQNCMLFVGGSVLYYAISIPLIVQESVKADKAGVQGEIWRGKYSSFMRTLLYLAVAPFGVFFSLVLLIGSYLDEQTCRRRFLHRLMITYQQRRIIKHKSRSATLQRRLLENMLPASIVKELQRQEFKISSWDQLKKLSQRHLGVSILFADIVGFTAMSASTDPSKVMVFLNELFQVFDNLCDAHSVYKVETVGDCYVAAVGVVTGVLISADVGQSCDSTNADQNTHSMVTFAKEAITQSRELSKPNGTPVDLRVGIHTGAVMSGLVGTKNLRFCLFGDTMNTAARMEQHGKPRHIHASRAVRDAASSEKWIESFTEVKGKGKMQTFYLKVID